MKENRNVYGENQRKDVSVFLETLDRCVTKKEVRIGALKSTFNMRDGL